MCQPFMIPVMDEMRKMLSLLILFCFDDSMLSLRNLLGLMCAC